jgi:hypothetical protein
MLTSKPIWTAHSIPEALLRKAGVPDSLEAMKIGDNIHTRIDESIRLYDKLLLVLSEHALASSWVEREVATALEKNSRASACRFLSASMRA